MIISDFNTIIWGSLKRLIFFIRRCQEEMWRMMIPALDALEGRDLKPKNFYVRGRRIWNWASTRILTLLRINSLSHQLTMLITSSGMSLIILRIDRIISQHMIGMTLLPFILRRRISNKII